MQVNDDSKANQIFWEIKTGYILIIHSVSQKHPTLFCLHNCAQNMLNVKIELTKNTIVSF